MADANNSGQFGNRSDTEEQSRRGGEASPTKFGSPKGADPHKAGEAGAKAQPHEAKVRGGESRQSDNNS